jgi:hypothetical protein
MKTITSADTSINSKKVPAVFKKIGWTAGMMNFDLGGGKFDTATEWLEKYGVKNYIYDPYNRSVEHNMEVGLLFGSFHTATLSNVLNVIKVRDHQLKALRTVTSALRKDGVLFITVYEGNRSGKGSVTKKGYQHNKKLMAYLPMIRKYFKYVEVRKGMIVASMREIS